MQIRQLTRAALVLAVVCCSWAAPRARADDATPPAVMAAAEAAVARIVEAGGDSYAGDCATVQSPRDLGKICSRFVAAQNGLFAFGIGRPFSEFSRWIFVVQTEAGWSVVATAPFDDFASNAGIPWPRLALAGP